MSELVKSVQVKDGRKYSVNSSGVTSLKREYIVVLDGPLDFARQEFAGVPQIGSELTLGSGVYAASYDIEEGRGSEKHTLKVTVNYERRTFEVSGGGESGKPEVTSQVDEWGWDAGTEERELMADAISDDKVVLNSANDPFESVPKVSTPAPTFTKVMKFKHRQSDWADCNCMVNKEAVTIGGKSYPAATLLCLVSEKRLIGDDNWKYQYTINLKYKTNPVSLGCGVEDIGWDVAIVDAGMREWVEQPDGNFKKQLIRAVDPETGKRCLVSSATLLDGNGKHLEAGNAPVSLKFAAYKRATFPTWFYSEPDTSQNNEPDLNE